ncbi:MAG: hypothetical protein AUJ54_06275 [Ignavibacteria bacterium CG1_02_37_35]|nr:MAG: hypothetical protein AUJ54_06275 [Ignavibacteria bacterium CG1_02_37_35]
MKTFILLLFAFVFTHAQIATEEDKQICKSKFDLAVSDSLSSKPIGDVITAIGKSFLGLNYEAFTLEKGEKETLVVHLTGLDCTTFLENCVVFSRCIKKGKTSFEDYTKELEFVRYRDGKMGEYPSRLHYFSDWIYNNTKKNIVEDVTKSFGGEPIKFKVGYMTKHPESYRQLKENEKYITIVAKQEKAINARTYFYIPKEKVDAIESQIHNGDLIAITTNLEGLDIGHVGVALKMDDGRIHFMHAPLVGAKVQISELPLGGYLAKVKKHTGIIVLRPQEAKK